MTTRSVLGWLIGVGFVVAAGLVLGGVWGLVLAGLAGASGAVWMVLRRFTELSPPAAATVAALVVLMVAQLVPYGRSHDNPPVTAEPQWDSAATRQFAERACFDCHSNETAWPWYTSVAPVSWVTQRHVDEGREALNYSEWDRAQEEAGESAETVEEGEMPLFDFLLVHPNARLTDAEKADFIRGLIVTFGNDD